MLREMYSIMLVDDHKMFRDGLKVLLESTNDFKVICEACNGNECIRLLKSYSPNIVILDIDMPELNGIGTLKAINRKRSKRPLVMVLSGKIGIDYLLDSLKYGADGYIMKSSGFEELNTALHIILNGDRYIQPSLIPLINSKVMTSNFDKEKIELLSDREIEVLKLTALGFINRDVGKMLQISERTVKNHLCSIYKKLNCTDRTQAAVFCIRNGIITVQD